ncbi:sulfotransferase domain-containing protein [Roseibium litorale]|nr:sulfotransferase domain-containing protein [Roseibium litorale]
MVSLYTNFRNQRRTQRHGRKISEHLKSFEDKGYDSPIIVAGYPKSGNTWLARVVAEAIGCPVLGFAGLREHDEIAMEGLERTSRSYVLKSHHTRDMLDLVCHPNLKILTIVRDPRDVAVSGKHYLFKGQNDAEGKMVGIMTHCAGGAGWDRRSWSEYVDQFLDPCMPMARYEDMLEAPGESLQQLFREAQIPVDRARIAAAIENQSFEKARQRFENENDPAKLQHMRQGRAGAYKKELSDENRLRLTRSLAPTMVDLNYLS